MISDCTAIPCIPTKDLKSARRFYETTLGLHMSGEDPGGITYEVGSGSLYLYESEYAGKAGHTLMNLESQHVDQDIADLREHGVRFETYPDMEGTDFDEDGVAVSKFEGVGEMKGVWFKDPDGNILALFQKSPVLASV